MPCYLVNNIIWKVGSRGLNSGRVVHELNINLVYKLELINHNKLVVLCNLCEANRRRRVF